MTKVRKIDVLSAAKIEAIMMGIFGLLIGLFFALFSTLVGSTNNSTMLGTGLGFLGIIILPIFYAIFGFIAGAIGAFIYNLASGWVGGIEVEFAQEEKTGI